MNTLEEVLNEWQKDSIIDQTEPGRALIDIPKLHNKYLRPLITHKMKSRKTGYDYMRLKKVKWEYFNGKLDTEELKRRKWEPFAFKLKSDLALYMDSDSDLIDLLEKKMVHDEIVVALESIMSEIKQRAWELKSFIQWEVFIGGQ